MKKFFSIFACFAVTILAAVLFTGCTQKASITYAISIYCTDSLYGANLGDYFETKQNGNTYRITAKNKTANAILAKGLNDPDCLQVNIYLTNNTEKFYRANLARVENKVSGLTLRTQDVVGSRINLKVNCPDASPLSGLNAVTINIAQGSTTGVYSVDNKGNRAVEMNSIKIVLEVVPYNSLND